MEGVHVFLNGDRGISVVSALLEHGHSVDAVYVPESKRESGFLRVLDGNGVSIVGVDRVNDSGFLESYRNKRPKLAVVAGFSTIFRKPLIECPQLGTLNLHGGPLPQYRGGSPLNWQIINGEVEAGVSVILMDEGIDTGPVVSEARFPITPADTIAEIHEKANKLFPRLTLDSLTKIEAGERGRQQDGSQACYWHQRCDDDGEIHWSRMRAQEVTALVRAIAHPYPGAWTRSGERVARVFAAQVFEPPLRGVPGRVVFLQGQGPIVPCADRAILITDYSIDDGQGRLRAGEMLE